MLVTNIATAKCKGLYMNDSAYLSLYRICYFADGGKGAAKIGLEITNKQLQSCSSFGIYLMRLYE